MVRPSGETPLSRRILDAAETVLRRYGAEKTNVVDIARVLGMSHGNIYRHFPSKQALLEAVAVRWLCAVETPLALIADDQTRTASARLKAWFDALRSMKTGKLRDDPELFRVHYNIVEAARAVVDEHVAAMLGQLEKIITDGMAAGEFSSELDPATAARAFLRAMSPFHHPALIMQGPLPTEEDAQAVLGLLLAGLRAGVR